MAAPTVSAGAEVLGAGQQVGGGGGLRGRRCRLVTGTPAATGRPEGQPDGQRRRHADDRAGTPSHRPVTPVIANPERSRYTSNG